MANEGVAILLLIALTFGGFLMTFNLIPGALHMSFNDISSISNGIWIILARVIVGPLLMIVSIWAIKKIIIQ